MSTNILTFQYFKFLYIGLMMVNVTETGSKFNK